MTAFSPVWTTIGNADGFVIQWGPMKVGDTGLPVVASSFVAGYADRSVQMEGTFGPATVSLAGSIDGVNYEILNDAATIPLSFTTPKIRVILESTPHIKPVVTSGDGTTSVTVSVWVRNLKI